MVHKTQIVQLTAHQYSSLCSPDKEEILNKIQWKNRFFRNLTYTFTYAVQYVGVVLNRIKYLPITRKFETDESLFKRFRESHELKNIRETSKETSAEQIETLDTILKLFQKRININSTLVREIEEAITETREQINRPKSVSPKESADILPPIPPQVITSEIGNEATEEKEEQEETKEKTEMVEVEKKTETEEEIEEKPETEEKKEENLQESICEVSAGILAPTPPPDLKVKNVVRSLNDLIGTLTSSCDRFVLYNTIINNENFQTQFKDKENIENIKIPMLQIAYSKIAAPAEEILTEIRKLSPLTVETFEMKDLIESFTTTLAILEMSQNTTLFQALQDVILFTTEHEGTNQIHLRTDDITYYKWLLPFIRNQKDQDFSPNVYCFQSLTRKISALKELKERVEKAKPSFQATEESLKKLNVISADLSKKLTELNRLKEEIENKRPPQKPIESQKSTKEIEDKRPPQKPIESHKLEKKIKRTLPRKPKQASSEKGKFEIIKSFNTWLSKKKKNPTTHDPKGKLPEVNLK